MIEFHNVDSTGNADHAGVAFLPVSGAAGTGVGRTFHQRSINRKRIFFHIIADVIQQPLTFVDKVAAQIIKNIKNRCIGPAERRFAGRNDVKSLRSVDGCTAADLRVTVIVINAVADRAGKRVFFVLILGMIVFFGFGRYAGPGAVADHVQHMSRNRHLVPADGSRSGIGGRLPAAIIVKDLNIGPIAVFAVKNGTAHGQLGIALGVGLRRNFGYPF